jgi:hypothetical protein
MTGALRTESTADTGSNVDDQPVSEAAALLSVNGAASVEAASVEGAALMGAALVGAAVDADSCALSAASEDAVATLLDRALRRVDCSKCRSCLEGTASMTAEQVCRSYVVRGSPLLKAACCYFEHSTSVGAIVQYLKTQLKGMTEGSLIRDVNAYMSAKGAFRLGTSDGPKPFKVTLYGFGQTTPLGKPMSVDRFGQPKADSAGAPHHYHSKCGRTGDAMLPLPPKYCFREASPASQ